MCMVQRLKNDNSYIYSKTSQFVNNLSKKTILLTGGTGFIGKWFLEFFLFLFKEKKIDLNVIVLSRNPDLFLKKYPKFNSSFLQFFEGDIVEFDFNLLPHCDFIIHAAAETNAQINLQHPLKIIDTVVNGTRKVLDFGVKINTTETLFLSSGAVYGVQPDNISGFSEDYEGGPGILSKLSSYAEAKRLAELICICYNEQYQMNISIARCFAFVGPYLPLEQHFAIGNFIRNGLNGEDIIVKGNGAPLRSYMYAADLVIWLLYIIFTGKSGQAYNVGSDNPISIKELAFEVANFFPDLSVKILGQVSSTDRNQDYIPNINKIKTELAVPAILTLKEAIHRTVQFYKGIE